MARRLTRRGERGSGDGAAGRAGGTAPGGRPPSKTAAAALSIASNTTLIILKVIAGVVTGSVAILTDALHSAVDLLASVVAYVSVRKADEPPDEEHHYGHEKIESFAAAIEGMLILVGSAVIVYEASKRLARGSELESLGVGIGIIGFSVAVNLLVSTHLYRRAHQTESAALEGDAAHLRADAFTSSGVLFALVLVQVTGATWLDSVVALAVAGVIVISGVRILRRSSRVLVDETLPPEEVDAIRGAIHATAHRGVVGYHKLRTRRAGSRRHVDLHVQFRAGTTLEAAHETAHVLQDEIASRLRNADVLIHLEPADRVRPGTEVAPRAGPGRSSPPPSSGRSLPPR